MPTGYTADIRKGISFEKFILNCARAFGALIEMRDEPMDKEIPDEFKPSTFYKEHLEEARAEFERLKTMDINQAEEEAKKEYMEEIESRKETIRKDAELRDKYGEMLSKARAWQPPTPGHQGLKEFMEQQITDSIKWDCGHSRYYMDHPIELKTGARWLQDETNSTLENIQSYEEEWQKEQDRARERTAWVKALRKSLETS